MGLLNGLLLVVEHESEEVYINALEVLSIRPDSRGCVLKLTDGTEYTIAEGPGDLAMRVSSFQSRLFPK